MKWLLLTAVLLASPNPAVAEQAKSGWNWLPSLPSIPSVSDWSFPDLAGAAVAGFQSFTDQVAESTPLLEAMGYQVVTFRIHWDLPPTAKLRLISKEAPADVTLDVALAAANKGTLTRTLIRGAVMAREIQSKMKLGTIVIDVDFALQPRMRMSFLDRDAKIDREIPGLGLAACETVVP